MSKSKLSTTEWDLVKDAPFWVNAALAAADGRVALITKRVEAKALGKALKNYKSSNALIRDVVGNEEDPDKAIKKATQSAAEKALGRISGIVERKLGDDDLDAFNDFLLSIGRSIAEAAGEGVLGIGKNTSDEESEALQSLASVLKATAKDKKDRRQAKQAAAQAKRAADAKAKAAAKATAAAKAKATADAKAKATADAKAKAEAAAKAKERAEKAKAVAARQAKFNAEKRKRDAETKARRLAKEKAEQKAAEEAKAKSVNLSRFTVFVAEHKVASGENLSVISQKYYNTQANWRFIYEANQDLIGDNPSLIRPGQLLKIPKL
jgi:nucleoid-associated protein YgaU